MKIWSAGYNWIGFLYFYGEIVCKYFIHVVNQYNLFTLYIVIFFNFSLHWRYWTSVFVFHFVLIPLAKTWIYFFSPPPCPVSWGWRIHWLHLCRGVRHPLTSVLDMTLNNLMVRLQQCWSFGECGVPLHCHCSQVHSGPEW